MLVRRRVGLAWLDWYLAALEYYSIRQKEGALL
jgi:hypothetical protein